MEGAKRKICRSAAEIYYLIKSFNTHTESKARHNILTEFEKLAHRIPHNIYENTVYKINDSHISETELICDFFELREHLTDAEYKYFMEQLGSIKERNIKCDEELIDLLATHSNVDYKTAEHAYSNNGRNILFALISLY